MVNADVSDQTPTAIAILVFSVFQVFKRNIQSFRSTICTLGYFGLSEGISRLKFSLTTVLAD